MTDELTPQQRKEMAKQYAESIIEDWVFEGLGEQADEYEISLDEMTQIAHLAFHAQIVVQ